MSTHVNIENDEVTIPYYAIHEDGKVFGFFGPFRFLSNFYILENGVCLNEMYFPSVEHAYQAAKWPQNQREQFVGITAGQSKKLGRMAPNFDGRKWNKQRVEVMSTLVRQKFFNNPKLGEMLLLTDGYKLEERNSWCDIFWGTNVNGEGDNNLGKILMSVRDALKLVKKGNVF